MLILTLLAATGLTVPDEPLAGRLHAAIWDDLQRNAMIGSGNVLAASWYEAGQDERPAPRLHIQALDCFETKVGQRCSFTLWREGGARRVPGGLAPDRLSCRAQFVRSPESEGWSVLHRLPRRAGHSRTDMRCRVVAGA
ncbi:hypothetical protein [uncultured Sphingomonas sp.]|uniref:hypothetical protein n=1 Tax=uncultured Sphingomonas sp. TaxID=158754 RepID=UPI00258DD353|nr:hypothetical protein [uncultured Sphingomonas sp.]